MGGKCVKAKGAGIRQKGKEMKALSDVVYREEISLRFKEIKALWPNRPYLDDRQDICSQDSPSRCSTPRWGTQDI